MAGWLGGWRKRQRLSLSSLAGTWAGLANKNDYCLILILDRVQHGDEQKQYTFHQGQQKEGKIRYHNHSMYVMLIVIDGVK